MNLNGAILKQCPKCHNNLMKSKIDTWVCPNCHYSEPFHTIDPPIPPNIGEIINPNININDVQESQTEIPPRILIYIPTKGIISQVNCYICANHESLGKKFLCKKTGYNKDFEDLFFCPIFDPNSLGKERGLLSGGEKKDIQRAVSVLS